MKNLPLLSAIIIAWAATANAQSYQWAKSIGATGDDNAISNNVQIFTKNKNRNCL